MKIFLLTTLTLMVVAGASSAQRSCGTMDYHQLKQQNDPAMEQRMAEYESNLQQWIEENSQAAVMIDTSISYPAIPGFHPTGNKSSDRVNYDRAKKEYLNTNPQVTEDDHLTPAAIDEKRKARQKNEFILTNH